MPETPEKPTSAASLYEAYRRRYGEKAGTYEEWLADEGGLDAVEARLGKIATGTEKTSSSTVPGAVQFGNGNQNIVSPHIEVKPEFHIGADGQGARRIEVADGNDSPAASPPERAPTPEDDPLAKKIEELTARVDKLEKEAAEKDKEIAELKAKLDEKDKTIKELEEKLEKAKKDRREPVKRKKKVEGLSIPDGKELEDVIDKELKPYRDRLVELTIRRKARMTDNYLIPGIGRRAEQDAAEYEVALEEYKWAVATACQAIREQAERDNKEPAEGNREATQFIFDEQENLIKAEFERNNEILDEIEHSADGKNIFKKAWAKRAVAFRAWGNYSTRRKIVTGVLVGGALTFASTTLGGGVALAAIATASKFSLGLFNRRASLRNVGEHSQKQQLARLQEQLKEAQKINPRTAERVGTNLDELLASMKTSAEGDVKHAQNRNKLGNALLALSVVLMGVGAHGALEHADTRSTFLHPFGHHHNPTPGAEHKGGLGSVVHHPHSGGAEHGHGGSGGHGGSTGAEGGSPGTHSGTAGTGAEGSAGAAGGTGGTGAESGSGGPTGTIDGGTYGNGTGTGTPATGEGIGTTSPGGAPVPPGIEHANPNGHVHSATVPTHGGGVEGGLPGSIDNIGNLPPHTHLAELTVHNGNWHDTIWAHVQNQAPEGQDLHKDVQEVLNLNRDRIMQYAPSGVSDPWQAAHYLPEHFKFVMPDSFGAEHAANVTGGLSGSSDIPAGVSGGLSGTSELPPLTVTGGAG